MLNNQLKKQWAEMVTSMKASERFYTLDDGYAIKIKLEDTDDRLTARVAIFQPLFSTALHTHQCKSLFYVNNFLCMLISERFKCIVDERENLFNDCYDSCACAIDAARDIGKKFSALRKLWI
jgi:hypothetical protein